MRRFLDGLYAFSGALAGFFIVAITLVILVQIVSRWMGYIVPSTDDLSGFFLAASSFLGLAYTLKKGGHIRVSLVIQRLSMVQRHRQEFLVLAVGSGLATLMSWHLGYMVYESWVFKDVSVGYLPIPLWIPQSSMSLGMLIFNIALVDELIRVLRGAKPCYQDHEDELNLEEV
ncbi:MAG: TRAP transporter small permease [Oceanospirillaceae bacterium]|jgi:TRAP-type C4-dicarboxylate transport system permease small subunit|tara:strand:- start:2417 stop:2935 length:519 start_codon:yes stop_codon:yes gene_type:complete